LSRQSITWSLQQILRLARAPRRLSWAVRRRLRSLDTRPIRTDKGEVLRTSRGGLKRLQAAPDVLCRAPWVSLDFRMDGSVGFCNHGAYLIGNATTDSLLEMWRGPRARQLREMFRRYEIPDAACAHCAHQLRLGQPEGTFAVSHFGSWDMQPDRGGEAFPRTLIFRLTNVCNLRCMMCNGAIRVVSRSDVEHRLPPRASREHDEFRLCDGCDRVYWKGSHYARLRALVQRLFPDPSDES